MQEIREVCRALGRAPLASTLIVLSLGLGIGANTGLFSVLNAIRLRPLPVRNPDQLVQVSSGIENTWVTNAVWEQIRDRRLFQQALAWVSDRFDLAAGGPTDFVSGAWASGSAFATLGLEPILGHTFTDIDDRKGLGPDGPVAVISHRLWKNRFRGSPSVVGERITIEGVPFKIVSVTPRDFYGPDVGLAWDIVLPIAAMPLLRPETQLDGRFGPWVSVMARLGDRWTVSEITATLRSLQSEIRAATLPEFLHAEDREAFLREPFVVTPASHGQSILGPRYERPLFALIGIAVLVLVVACVNVMNLFLAQTASRRHELSIRRALGATPLRLASRLFMESALLSTLGATLGLILAWWGSRFLVHYMSTPLYTVALDLSLDWRVLVATAVVGLATTLFFGTVPALRAARADPIEALKEGQRGVTGRSLVAVGSATAAVQIAASVVLVTGAGLFQRTFTTLTTMNVGFDRDRILVANLDVRRSRVSPTGRGLLAERVREAVAAVPGIARAAVSMVLPEGTYLETRDIQLPPGTTSTVHANQISSGWFRTLGIPLLMGRDFDGRDQAGAPPVAIVNEAFVRHFWKGPAPIGQLIVEAGGQRHLEVVGVASNAAYHSILEPAPPTLYLPIAQSPAPLQSAFILSLRPTRDFSAPLERLVGQAIGTVDRDVSVTFRSLKDQVNASFLESGLLALLSGFFGGLALLLSGLGVYGLMAHAVALRRTEIGIRMALGARPRGVLRMVMVRVTRVLAVGVAIGIAGSVWAGRLIGSLLYDVEPQNLVTIGSACALVISVGLAASWLPARRAATIDPARVLHHG